MHIETKFNIGQQVRVKENRTETFYIQEIHIINEAKILYVSGQNWTSWDYKYDQDSIELIPDFEDEDEEQLQNLLRQEQEIKAAIKKIRNNS